MAHIAVGSTVRIRDIGRLGELIADDGSDHLPLKVRFNDGNLPSADWFEKCAVELALPIHALGGNRGSSCGYVTHNAPSASSGAAPSGASGSQQLDDPTRTLCVLVHGMGGSKDDYRTWQERLEVRCPEWTLRVLSSITPHLKPLIGDGLDFVSSVVATEILEAVRDIEKTGVERLTLHCIGHSMGGLLLRGALPRVFEEAPYLIAGVFLTLSTPHLGVQASWGAPETMWRNLSVIAGVVSPQLPQLAVQDKFASRRRRPYLVEIAEKDGVHVKTLGRFRERACVTMMHGDVVIPTASGCLWARSPWVRPELPVDVVAGWGFESQWQSDGSSSGDAFASASSSALSLPVEASPRSREFAAGWTKSADGACYFPRQILEGLDSLPWHRVVVRLRMLKASPTTHVFLIGKASDQSELEHAFARECIEDLIDLLKALVDGRKFDLGAPRWSRTVEVKATTRDKCSGRWVVVSEEGIGAVKYYPFDTKVEANFCFDNSLSSLTTRVLFDTMRVKQRGAGPNVASVKTICNQFTLPPATSVKGKWTVVSEEGTSNIQFYTSASEAEALKIFDSFRVISRVLFDPQGAEVKRAGWNVGALDTIVRVFRREMQSVEHHT